MGYRKKAAQMRERVQAVLGLSQALAKRCCQYLWVPMGSVNQQACPLGPDVSW